MPSTKQIESRMLDFPLPLRPVMALNFGSKLGIVTRVAYDLKPSRVISSMCIATEQSARCGGRTPLLSAGVSQLSMLHPEARL